MQTWTRIHGEKKEFQGGTLTLGNFDGLHFGHRALLKSVVERPKPSVVVTFDPHPLKILQPERVLHRIFPRSDLVEQLPALGIDLLVILAFDEAMARTDAEEFWRKYIIEPFRPSAVVVGHDFAFGKNRAGNLEFLKHWCSQNKVSLQIVEPLKDHGEVYSSREIRELVRRGQVEAAALKLGRPFYLRGLVGRGAGRGAGIGIPTMNFVNVKEILPSPGVYATRTVWQGKRFPSVTNIGINPTFGGLEGLKIETHVMGQSLEVRDQILDVEFIRHLRPEMKFASVEDLKNQIKTDILKAHEALDNFKPAK